MADERIINKFTWEDVNLDQVADGVTYGRVKNSLLSSGRVVKLAEAAGKDLTVALGAANRVLTLGANVALDQNLRTTDTPTLAGLTIVNPITEFSTDGTLSGTSDLALPTEKAVKTYVLSQIGGHNEFTELLDTPSSYDTIDGSTFVMVKSDLTGLEFVDGDSDAVRALLGLGTADTPALAGLTIVNAIDEFSTDGTLGDDSDSALVTEKAIRTYVASQVELMNEFTELTDTPSYYDTDDGDKFVRVRADLLGLEFVDGDSDAVRTDLGLGTGDSPAFAAATIGSVAIPGICTAMTEPTGFVDKVAVLSWDDPTYTFTITGNHDIYINGVKTTKTTDSIQIGDTTGLHYVYYNAAGTLVSATVHPGFSLPLVATVYWNTTTNKGLVGEERHGIKMDGDTHSFLHYTVGTRYESGLTGSFTDTTITITAGIIADEDLSNSIAQQTTCNVLYKNGAADFQWDAGATVYYKMNGANIRYNNGNALADAGPSRHVAYWIFATNDQTTPIVALMGQRQDVLLADARANNTYESLTLGTLPFEEMKLLYRVILKNTGAPPSYVEVQDLRSVSNLPAGTYIATSHSVLTDLGTDDHSQYALLIGRSGGQTLAGSDTTAEDLTLKDNTVDNNTITVTQAIAAYTHVSNNGSDHSYIDQAVTVLGTPTFAGLTIVNAITEFSTDGLLSGNSDSALPTEKATKTYVDAQIFEHAEFIALQDVPTSYDTEDGGKFVKVREDLVGLEFVDVVAGYFNRDDPATPDGEQIQIHGTISAQSNNHLIDTVAGDFVNDGVQVGDWVYNATGALAYAQVTVVNSGTDLTLDANIFPDDDGDAYRIWHFKGNAVWTEWDLSSIVGAVAAVVRVRVHGKQVAAPVFKLRKKGETGINWSAWKRVETNIEEFQELLVATDSSGIVEYSQLDILAPPENAANYLDLTVVGWWV